MSGKPILYSYWRSSCSWRVRAALELKGIDYVYKPVDLVKGDQHSDEFLKLNPLAKVPALVIDGETLFESLAILEYLDERYPDRNPLFPKGLVERAKVRAVALQIAAGIQPIQNVSILKEIGSLTSSRETAFAWAKKIIEDGFDKLERQLQATAGKFAVGDSLTVADLCIPPQVYNANRYGVNVNAYPTIKRLDEALTSLEAMKKSHPSVQPDTPESDTKS